MDPWSRSGPWGAVTSVSEESLTKASATTARGTFRDDRYALEVRIQQLEQELDSRRKTVAKLESESIQHLRTISDLRSEENARFTQQAYHHKRELENDREKVRQLSAELHAEREKVTFFESRAQQMSLEVMRLHTEESRATELEANLRDYRTENTEQKRVRSALEFKISESTKQERVLEGKIIMLQQLLEERNTELSEQHEKTNAVTMKVDDLKSNLVEMQRKVDLLERQKGEASVLLEQRTRELDRAENRFRFCSKEAEEMLAKLLKAENAKQQIALQCETDVNDIRNEMRLKVRTLQQLEIENAQLRDHLTEHSGTIAKDRLEIQHLTEEASSTREEINEMRRRVEDWQSSSARDQVAIQGLKEETERLKRCNEMMRTEMVNHEGAQSRLEQRNHELEQSLRRKTALEEQIRSLQLSFERQEEDMSLEIQMHTETKRRLTDASEYVEQAQWLTERLRESEMEMEANQERMQGLTVEAERTAHLLEEVRRELDREVGRGRGLEEQLREEGKTQRTLEVRLAELEREAMRVCSLEGKCEGLDKMINQKRNEICELTEANNTMNLTIQSLEKQLLAIEPLEERVRELELERTRMQQQLDEQDDRCREYEREISSLTTRCRSKDSELIDEHQRYRELEEEVLRCKRIVVEKAVVEERCREALSSLNTRTEELDRNRAALEECRMKLRSSETHCVSLEESVMSLQKRLQMEVEVVQQQMVLAGKNTVALEESDRERSRLVKEIEWVTQQAEVSQDLTRRLQDELSARLSQVEALGNREQTLTTIVEELTSRIDEGDNRNAAVKVQLSESQQRVLDLENRVSELLVEVRERTVKEGRFASMERLLEERETEIRSLLQTASESRLKMREAESEIAQSRVNDQKLRELRAQNTHQMVQLEALEAELAQKTSVIIVKDKEHVKDRDVIRELQSRLEEDMFRRQSTDIRLRDLEAANQELKAFEGRTRGLETLVEERAKDLEKERSENDLLRARVRQMEKGYTAMSRLEDTVKELEIELSTKCDIITRHEMEEARRKERIDRQRQGQGEAERSVAALNDEITRLRMSNSDLQNALVEAQREAQSKIRVLSEEHRMKLQEAQRNAAELEEMRDRLQTESGADGRRAERESMLEDEVWALKRQLSQVERNDESAAASLDDMRRQLQSEKQSNANLTLSLQQMRERYTNLEANHLSSSGSHTKEAQQRAADIRAREDEIARLKSDMADMRTQLQRNTETQVVQRLQEHICDLEKQLRHAPVVVTGPVDCTVGLVQDLKLRLRDEEQRNAELSARLHVASGGAELTRSSMFDELARKDKQIAELKQQLGDVIRGDTVRMQGVYESTISNLTYKGHAAEEAVDRLHEMKKCMAELRRENQHQSNIPDRLRQNISQQAAPYFPSTQGQVRIPPHATTSPLAQSQPQPGQRVGPRASRVVAPLATLSPQRKPLS